MSEQDQIEITRAGEADAPVVAVLVHRLLDELSGGKASAPDRLEETTALLLAGGRVDALLAWYAGVPVRVLTLNECASIYAGGVFGEISELFVDPAHRSARIAPRLIAEAAAIGRQRGWGRIEVGAPGQPTWSRPLQFYLREGFDEVGPRLRLMLGAFPAPSHHATVAPATLPDGVPR